ncbi:MAG: hypothetical protein WD906_00855 [Anaerolineales bacterium]
MDNRSNRATFHLFLACLCLVGCGPIATATPLPTSTPSPTATPTPTVTPTPVWTAQSACDHPYFPLRQGARWAYTSKLPEGPATLEVIVNLVTGDLQRATAETTDYTYHCDATGLTYSAPNFIAGTVRTLGGVLLPPVDQLTLGSSWDYVYEFSFTTVQGEIKTSTFSLNHTVSGTDSVIFDGVTYDGLQITIDQDADEPGFLGARVRTQSTFTRTWARTVGLIEDQVKFLDSYSIP